MEAFYSKVSDIPGDILRKCAKEDHRLFEPEYDSYFIGMYIHAKCGDEVKMPPSLRCIINLNDNLMYANKHCSFLVENVEYISYWWYADKSSINDYVAESSRLENSDEVFAEVMKIAKRNSCFASLLDQHENGDFTLAETLALYILHRDSLESARNEYMNNMFNFTVKGVVTMERDGDNIKYVSTNGVIIPNNKEERVYGINEDEKN